MSDLPEVEDYPGWAVLVSAVVGLGAAFLLVWWASGFALSSEQLFRVAPTVEGGGVGADWTAGNQLAWLDFLVALTHAADVIMGLFILFLLFLHWASFRQLAARMRRPGEEREERVAADGGEQTEGLRASSNERSEFDGGEASAKSRPARQRSRLGPYERAQSAREQTSSGERREADARDGADGGDAP